MLKPILKIFSALTATIFAFALVLASTTDFSRASADEQFAKERFIGCWKETVPALRELPGSGGQCSARSQMTMPAEPCPKLNNAMFLAKDIPSETPSYMLPMMNRMRTPYIDALSKDLPEGVLLRVRGGDAPGSNFTLELSYDKLDSSEALRPINSEIIWERSKPTELGLSTVAAKEFCRPPEFVDLNNLHSAETSPLTTLVRNVQTLYQAMCP